MRAVLNILQYIMYTRVIPIFIFAYLLISVQNTKGLKFMFISLKSNELNSLISKSLYFYWES